MAVAGLQGDQLIGGGVAVHQRIEGNQSQGKRCVGPGEMAHISLAQGNLLGQTGGLDFIVGYGEGGFREIEAGQGMTSLGQGQ